MSPQSVGSCDTHGVEQTRWRLDPDALERRVPRPPLLRPHDRQGTVQRYEGTLDLRSAPAVRLTIAAESLDTKQTKRDQHLRSGDFFDVERYAQVQFISDRATLDRDHLEAHGQLHAAGKTIPLELDATLSHVDGELELQAITRGPPRARHDLEPARHPPRPQQTDRQRPPHTAGRQ
jgi:polyisoprenoid-binding protein YceI